MQKTFVLFTALLIVCAPKLYAQPKQRSTTPHAPGEDIYKHYTGTIGNKKVMVDLRYGYQGGSNYGGTLCYTPDQDAPVMLMILEPASYDHGVPMTGREYRTAGDWTNRDTKHSRWQFVIGHQQLTGMWYSADGKDSARISLSEDYTQSYPLDLVIFQEQQPAAEHAAVGSMGAGQTVYLMTVLSSSSNADEAAYINSELISFMGRGNIGALTQSHWRKYPAAAAKEHFRNLTTSNFQGTVSMRLNLLPLYNDWGMLALRRTEGDYGTEVITYLNLDVRNKRKWTFNDILAPDNEKLSALLETTLRQQYSIHADSQLTTLLNVSKMPLTQNVMVTGKGLYFTYRVGEIASKDQLNEDVNLFIPYSQLKAMLRPDFKKRMEL